MEIYKNRRMLTGAALLCTFALTLSVFPVHATDSIESLESQTSALEKELAGINQDILDLSNQISDTEMQIEILNSSIDKTQDDLLDAEEKENKQYEDMKTRIKENTWATKEHIIRTKLLPYFGKLKMCNITAQQIITWQNEMLDHKDENGKKYSPAYLRSVNNQLSAIFNHAVRYYDLRENPCKKAGSMGKKKNRKMLFWTKEEYLKFAEVMMDKPLSFYAFEMLYWCGIREGELLALTPADFDFEKCTVSITKSYQRLNGQDLITTPKTEKSNRVIKMPQFLADEMQDYLKQLYGISQMTGCSRLQRTIFTVRWAEAQRKQELNAFGFMTFAIAQSRC